MPGSSALWRAVVPGAAALSMLAAVVAGNTHADPARAPAAATGPTYAMLGRAAVATVKHSYYHGAGLWNICVPAQCGTSDHDWGADSLTYALYFHWRLTHDKTVIPLMNALTASARTYTPTTAAWSDAPLWDSVATALEYQVTGNPLALAKAEAAFNYVATDQAAAFATGACPAIQYQLRNGGTTKVKTLETSANYIRAALLLYQITKGAVFLQQAQTEYAAVRQYFLDPAVPLYSVYVFDNGATCTQVPGRFFGSVNGLMISNGLTLAQDTGQAAYRTQAIATAKAVGQDLNDAAGVYADLQAENDVTEPLIEAMYNLATQGHQTFARLWLLRAASAAASGVTAGGEYGRFFDGPPPQAPVTAWQVAGGLTLEQAAGALDPAAAHPAGLLDTGGPGPRRPEPGLHPDPVHLHRAGRRDHGHDRRGLLRTRPRAGVHRRETNLRPDRHLAEQVQLRAESAELDPVRLALADAGHAHHRDRPRRPERQGRQLVLPHDRLPAREVASRRRRRARAVSPCAGSGGPPAARTAP